MNSQESSDRSMPPAEELRCNMSEQSPNVVRDSEKLEELGAESLHSILQRAVSESESPIKSTFISESFRSHSRGSSDSVGVLDRVTREVVGHAGPVGLAKLAKLLNEHLPIATEPVEVRLKDVNYSVKGKRADPFVGKSPETARTKVRQAIRFLSCIPIAERILKGPNPIVEKKILEDINLQFPAGEMTLILGPPHSGRTSLLKCIADQLPKDNHSELSGDISFAGESTSSSVFHLNKIVAYIPEYDAHIANLTVRETLEFAYNSMEGGVAANGMTCAVADLTEAQDTIVGDAFTRGISGGEKRRVTIGEMLAGTKNVLLMDKISNGLDTCTTNQIMSSIRDVCREFKKTVIVALNQPPPETWEIFDRIVLMSCGRVVYSGKRTSARAYFQDLGYNCPDYVDEADFFSKLLGGRELEIFLTPGVQPLTHHEMATRWSESTLAEELRKAMTISPKKAKWAQTQKRQFAGSWIYHFMMCFKRDALVFYRSRLTRYMSCIVSLGVGLYGGGMFFQVNKYDFVDVSWGMFFTTIFVVVSQIRVLGTMFNDRPIFYKETAQKFYPISAYYLSLTIWAAVTIIIVYAFFLPVIYYMIGLSAPVGKFVIYFLTILGTAVCFGSFYRLLATVSVNFSAATAISFLVQLSSMVYAGQMIPLNNIPYALIWIYYINPVQYCLKALMLNEFSSKKYNVCVIPDADPCPPGVGTIEEIALNNFDIDLSDAWIWISMVIIYGLYAVFTILAAILLHYIRFDNVAHSSIPDDKMMAPVSPSDSIRSSHHVVMKAVNTPNGNLEEISVETIAHHRSPSLNGPQKEKASVVGWQSTPATLSFRNISYSVSSSFGDKDLVLLNNVSGFTKAGRMTAIMGTSGAGKTTLLDVLSGRKTGGTITGEIFINGYPKTAETWSRMVGYVEQFDSHSAYVTVREAVQFSGLMRLDRKRCTTSIEDYIDDIIHVFELDDISNCLIGSDEKGGISRMERKITNIAVELAADPAILFLDEPTTSMDADAAQVVVNMMSSISKKLCRAVTCTIHQPSTHIFDKRGGQLVFFGEIGEHSQSLINYFTSELKCQPIKPHTNPATWMLEQIDTEMIDEANREERRLEISRTYNNSSLFQQNNASLKVLCDKCGDEPKFAEGYAVSDYSQFLFLLSRSLKQQWRCTSYNFMVTAICCIIAILSAWSFVRSTPKTESDVYSLVSIIFFSESTVCMLFAQTSIPYYMEERIVFYREQASRMYKPFAWCLAALVSELPFNIFTVFMYGSVFYFMANLSTGEENKPLLWYYVTLVLLGSVFKTFGMAIAVLSPNSVLGLTFATAISTFLILAGGFLIPMSAIPDYFKWISYFDPFASGFLLVIMTQFRYDDRLIINSINEEQTISSFVYDAYLHDGIFSYDRKFIGILILCALLVAMNILFIYGAINVRYIRR